MGRHSWSPWDPPLEMAIMRRFKDLGEVLAENDRKTSYFVGRIVTIEAIFVSLPLSQASTANGQGLFSSELELISSTSAAQTINAGAINGSYSHFLDSVAQASLLPISDVCRYEYNFSMRQNLYSSSTDD